MHVRVKFHIIRLSWKSAFFHCLGKSARLLLDTIAWIWHTYNQNRLPHLHAATKMYLYMLALSSLHSKWWFAVSTVVIDRYQHLTSLVLVYDQTNILKLTTHWNWLQWKKDSGEILFNEFMCSGVHGNSISSPPNHKSMFLYLLVQVLILPG
jgi:hypothetical protein